MRHIFLWTLAATLCLTMTACGEDDDGSSDTASNTTSEAQCDPSLIQRCPPGSDPMLTVELSGMCSAEELELSEDGAFACLQVAGCELRCNFDASICACGVESVTSQQLTCNPCN